MRRAATPISREGQPVGPTTRAVLAVVLALAASCAPRSLLDRAIRARGGPLHSLTRAGEARIQAGFPGVWSWRSVYLLPDRYALTVETATQPYHYLFDGTTVRAFFDGRAIAEDPEHDAPLRSHARFTAVANLDALRLPRYRVMPLGDPELPPGARAGLDVVEIRDGARYRLGFDERGLLAWVVGPLDLRPVGRGEATARFDDFRGVAGLLLPFRTAYSLGARPVLEERALAVCPNLASLTTEAFRDPARLPACGAPGTATGPGGALLAVVGALGAPRVGGRAQRPPTDHAAMLSVRLHGRTFAGPPPTGELREVSERPPAESRRRLLGERRCALGPEGNW